MNVIERLRQDLDGLYEATWLKNWILVVEAKRLREQMSKLGYSRRDIIATLWLYGVHLSDMGY